MLKIALAGNMRAGKDVSAEYIKKTYLNTAKLFSFAEPIYDILHMVQDSLGFKQEKNRVFLQFLGDWARKQQSDIWVDKLIKKMEFTTTPIFVTDARYLNELTRLKEENFIIVRINADENIRIARGATNLSHSSELELDLFKDYDYIIDNNTSFENLYSQLDRVIIKYINKE